MVRSLFLLHLHDVIAFEGKFGLSGPLPTWLPALTKLHSLDLAINKFTGSIPADLGNLKLEVLYLYDNQLRGAVPAINFDRIKYVFRGWRTTVLSSVLCTVLYSLCL